MLKNLFGNLFDRGQPNGVASAAAASISLTAPDFIADPYPLYARLRQNEPLAALSGGGYLLCRYQDISAALTDPRLGNAPSRFSVLNARHADRYLASSMAGRLLPFLDMPEHRLPRQALTRSFFKSLDGFASTVEELADKYVEAARGRFELISSVASPYACEVMIRFVGLDCSPESLKSLTWPFFHLFAPIGDAAAFVAVNERLAEGRDLICRSLRARRAQPSLDLLSQLARCQADSPELSDDHIIDLAFLVAADGVENIEAGTALVLRRILSEPELARESLEVPSLEPIVREALRLETPAQIIPRIARQSFELHGTEIAQDVPVFLALGSGNRDVAALPQADNFEHGRSGSPLTFGLGRHRCIGEPLAVMMNAVLVKTLLRRRVQQTEADRQFTFHSRFGHRWPMKSVLSRPVL